MTTATSTLSAHIARAPGTGTLVTISPVHRQSDAMRLAIAMRFLGRHVRVTSSYLRREDVSADNTGIVATVATLAHGTCRSVLVFHPQPGEVVPRALPLSQVLRIVELPATGGDPR